MKIKWLEETELEIWNCRKDYDEDYDEEYDEDYEEDDDSYTSEFENTVIGEIEEVDILDENKDAVDMQFGNGSVVYGVPRECFEIIEED